MKNSEFNPIVVNPPYLHQVLEIESIYDSAPVGLCVLDKDLRYVRLNRCLAEMNGVPVNDHIGRTPKEIVPDIGDQAEAVLRKVLEAGEVIKIEVAGETKAHPGVKRYYDETWAPIRDFSGNIVGISIVAIDVTEQKKALDSLRVSNERKNNLISMLSHELRNPLAAITASLALLEYSSNMEEKSRQAVEVLKRQTTQLSRLVDDLLDVTRISRNIVELKKKCLEVNRLACQAVIDHQKHFSTRGIILEFECEPDPVYIDADPVRISQILGNLLHNASKFSEKGDRVKLKVESDKRHSEVVITVSDTGQGISQEILLEIFEPFYQADTSLNRENGGIGLGLAIVKGMTELHGGSVDAASDGPGRGSKFTVRLPLSENIVPHENQTPQVKNRTLDSLRILIIEDNPDLLEILCDLLEALGHDAISAEDGPVGIRKAKEMKPDVILCDIGLPGISGYEVAEKIRSDEELKNTFMIALSGYAQQRDIERSKEAGFRRHLAKPVQLDILKMALGEAAVNIKVC